MREREGLVLAGKIMGMVDAFGHYPLWQLDTEDAAAHDKRVAAEILAALPVGALWVCDLGFFSFRWFEDVTASNRSFGTRMREKTAYRTVQERSRGWYYRDELIEVGKYRSNQCRHPVRMVAGAHLGRDGLSRLLSLPPGEGTRRG